METGMQEALDLVEKAIRKALESGAEFVDARIQSYEYQYMVVDNGRLRDATYTTRGGVGFRVLYRGSMGYASTTSLDEERIVEAVERAFRSARALGDGSVRLAPYRVVQARARSRYILDPFDADDKEKIDVILTANKAAMEVGGVVSAVTALGLQRDKRIIVNREGSRVEVEVVATGITHSSIARVNGNMESVGDYETRIEGFEFIRSYDWQELAVEASRLAVIAAGSRVPPAGSYPVVLEPRMVGLLLHEALGHASEGDIVASGASVLKGRIGDTVAASSVTIIDDGLVEGGYYVPFDDEGVEKRPTTVVEEGVLRSYITDRASAAKLGVEPTGNGRVMSYSHPVLARQTNYYMKPGDYTVEELIEEVDEGFYVTVKGSKGGEVDPGMGTFTFSAGVSWRIERGRLAEPVRGVSLSGNILEALKNVRAVGRDFEVETSVFGGCGKQGQLVRVGTGGPHVLVDGIVVGGR